MATLHDEMENLSQAFRNLGTVFGISAVEALRKFSQVSNMLSDHITPFTEIRGSTTGRTRGRFVPAEGTSDAVRFIPREGANPADDVIYVYEEEELPVQCFHIILSPEQIKDAYDMRDRSVHITLQRYGDGTTEVFLGERKIGELDALRERPLRKAFLEPLPPPEPLRIEKPKNVRLIREK